jgi:putative endonuclease
VTRGRLITGRAGEEIAARHLARHGYRILARGWRTRLGELDLVAAREGLLVFVEVKTRRGGAFGPPAAAVHALKQARVARMARQYLAEGGHDGDACRFDVIAVTLRHGAEPLVEHIEDAFRLV